MCYPKPGPRCSNHVGKELLNARDTYHWRNEEESHQAYREKVKEYLATPAGIKILEDAYGKDSDVAITHRAKRKKMLEDFHIENPDYNKKRAEAKFDKKSRRRAETVERDLRHDLVRDRFVSDALRADAYIDRESKYNKLIELKQEKGDRSFFVNGSRTVVDYYNDNYVIYSEGSIRAPMGSAASVTERNAARFMQIEKNGANVHFEAYQEYARAYREFMGTDEMKTGISVRGYIPSDEMSSEEYTLQDQMSRNVKIIKSLQEEQDRIRREDKNSERTVLIGKIDEKINEGYHSLDILSTKLREHSEANRTLNYLKELEKTETMNVKDAEVFDRISKNQYYT